VQVFNLVIFAVNSDEILSCTFSAFDVFCIDSIFCRSFVLGVCQLLDTPVHHSTRLSCTRMYVVHEYML